MRVLLIDLPFSSLHRPSLSLSSLRAALAQAGHQAEILYAKYSFAEAIGFDQYDLIAENSPPDMLLPERVFSPLLRDRRLISPRTTPTAASPFLPQSDEPTRSSSSITRTLDLPQLQTAAHHFILTLAHDIARTKPDLLGLSATFQLTPSLALAAALKLIHPILPIVLGGPCCDYPAGPAILRAFPFIDFLCQGEGEELILKLPQALLSEQPLFHQIPGLVWRRGTEIVANGHRAPIIRNLNHLPHPEYEDWLDQLATTPTPIHRDTLALPFESSRGCWYGEKNHCTFCGLNGPTLTYRRKSPSRVAAEIDRLATLGIQNLEAVDLILDHRAFVDYLPAFERRSDLRFFYEVKSNLSKQHVRSLRSAGIVRIQPGIESLSTDILRIMKKGVAAYQNIRLLKWAVEFGIQVDWNLLYGFPGEDAREYSRMAALVPLLAHLAPPPRGCTEVRIARFSPLYDWHSQNHPQHLRPLRAYFDIFDLDEPLIRDMAYYFTSDIPHQPARYAQPLLDSIERWRSVAGTCCLVAYSKGGSTHVVDTRPGATRSYSQLDGPAGEVLTYCDRGIPLQSLRLRFPGRETELDTALDALSSRGWLIAIDGRYLSLPVSISYPELDSLSLSILPAVLEAVALTRSSRLIPNRCGPISPDPEPGLQAVPACQYY